MQGKRIAGDIQRRYHRIDTYDYNQRHTYSGSYPAGKHTHTHESTQAVLNRLSKAIGHLGAVRRMVDEGRDCSEVLIQLAAVRSAVNGICKIILKDHIDHCIVDAIKFGDIETINELKSAVDKLIK
jgi:DNA-binding FrmR family transcriptional regulator